MVREKKEMVREKKTTVRGKKEMVVERKKEKGQVLKVKKNKKSEFRNRARRMTPCDCMHIKLTY